ncbi:MAG: hypothetical protein KatS3mg031_0238 [Chitinophagales bacterium]|nr:MAG: hypothetical protein KatS3mg031_0238 [Chitinophagales bacterium]
MQKIYSVLFATLSMMLLTATAESQTCRIIRSDSTSGSGAGSYTDYLYTTGTQFALASHVSSMGVTTSQDIAYYNGSGNLEQIQTFSTTGTPTLLQTIRYFYPAAPAPQRVTRISVWGNDAGGFFRTSHDISYDANGKVQSITLIPDSLQGNPKGFDATLSNITWQNGNISSMNLEIGGITIALELSFDDKNNIYRKLLNNEDALRFLLEQTQNNILTIRTRDSVSIGGQTIPANTALFQRSYTYNANNDVITMTESPTFFVTNSYTVSFTYDCQTGIDRVNSAGLQIYPNPVAGQVYIKGTTAGAQLLIYDTQGAEVFKTLLSADESAIDVRTLRQGLYFVEVVSPKAVQHCTFIKRSY